MALTLLQPFNLDPNGNYTFANANLTGNVNASYFIGNGSQLTGIAGGNVTTSATPPVSPSEGDWWINNNTATMYVYFNDGTSNQWAEMEAYQSISSNTPNATALANGNSNINIATSGGNVDISVAGNSNVVSISGTTVLVAGNINPAANITYNLGNASYRWNNLFLAGNTIDLGGAVIQATSNAIVFTNPEGGNFTVEGNTATNTAAIINGTSNVAIDIANGNVTFGVNGTNNAVVISDSTISGPNNITSNYFTGRVYGAANTVANSAQSNITSVGTLTSLNVSGNITAPNIIANSGTFIGNGVGLTFIAGGNVSGAVSFASTANSVAGANVSGEVGYAAVANSVAAANIVGTVSDAANANVANTASTVTTNAQPNITSVGTLSNLAVTGNITSGNIYANSGTIGANLLSGTLATADQPNITNLGTLGNLNVTGNITIGGNFTVTGNISYANTTDLVIQDPLIYLASNNVGDTEDIGFVGNWDPSDGPYQHGGMARDHTDRTWKFFSNVVAEPTTTIDWANAIYDPVKMGSLTVVANIVSGNANLGNTVTANYFSGNLLGGLSNGTSNVNIPSTNGNVNISVSGNANVAVITGTGVNVAGTLDATGNITGNYFIGNGSQLTGVNTNNPIAYAWFIS